MNRAVQVIMAVGLLFVSCFLTIQYQLLSATADYLDVISPKNTFSQSKVIHFDHGGFYLEHELSADDEGVAVYHSRYRPQVLAGQINGKIQVNSQENRVLSVDVAIMLSNPMNIVMGNDLSQVIDEVRIQAHGQWQSNLSTIEGRVKKVLAQSLGLDASIASNASLKDHGVDVSASEKVVMSLEDKLGIHLTREEVKKMQTVADIVSYIKKQQDIRLEIQVLAGQINGKIQVNSQENRVLSVDVAIMLSNPMNIVMGNDLSQVIDEVRIQAHGQWQSNLSTIEGRVKKVLAQSLGLDASIASNASLKDHGVDVSASEKVVMSLEDELGIHLPREEVKKMQTVADIVSYIKKQQDIRLEIDDARVQYKPQSQDLKAQFKAVKLDHAGIQYSATNAKVDALLGAIDKESPVWQFEIFAKAIERATFEAQNMQIELKGPTLMANQLTDVIVHYDQYPLILRMQIRKAHFYDELVPDHPITTVISGLEISTDLMLDEKESSMSLKPLFRDDLQWPKMFKRLNMSVRQDKSESFLDGKAVVLFGENEFSVGFDYEPKKDSLFFRTIYSRSVKTFLTQDKKAREIIVEHDIDALLYQQNFLQKMIAPYLNPVFAEGWASYLAASKTRAKNTVPNIFSELDLMKILKPKNRKEEMEMTIENIGVIFKKSPLEMLKLDVILEYHSISENKETGLHEQLLLWTFFPDSQGLFGVGSNFFWEDRFELYDQGLLEQIKTIPQKSMMADVLSEMCQEPLTKHKCGEDMHRAIQNLQAPRQFPYEVIEMGYHFILFPGQGFYDGSEFQIQYYWKENLADQPSGFDIYTEFSGLTKENLTIQATGTTIGAYTLEDLLHFKTPLTPKGGIHFIPKAQAIVKKLIEEDIDLKGDELEVIFFPKNNLQINGKRYDITD